jgi:NAD/NADP transhydrogenase beta subunit
MAEPLKPGILPPRPSLRERAERLFSDRNLDLFAHFLDDCLRIPGTRIRLGFDGVIGLIPGLGDVLAGIASFVLIVAAWVRGVPYVTLARMMVNLGLGVLVGAIPFLGDAFDIFWKANRRNYRLMTRHLREPHRHTWRDYVFLLVLAAIALILLSIPVFVVLLIVLWFLHRL